MSTINFTELIARTPILKEMAAEKEIVWINPEKTTFEKGMEGSELTMKDVEDAEARLARFAPFIFPGSSMRKWESAPVNTEMHVTFKLSVPVSANEWDMQHKTKWKGMDTVPSSHYKDQLKSMPTHQSLLSENRPKNHIQSKQPM